ncbi:2',3'-cyclic-nucleotide 3'-phosphodiesterase [Diutina catenulata]
MTNRLGVALWLCPRQNTGLYDKLTTLMSSLNTLFPGQPPRFEPHVTITTQVAVDLDDAARTRDDVDRVLGACVAALRGSPKDQGELVVLGKLDSQRKYFKKLYFEVERNPSLVSFAQIIRELFVILPGDIAREQQRANPELYTTAADGSVQRKKSKSKKQVAEKAVDTSEIRQSAPHKAAAWAQDEFHPHLSLVYSEMHPISNALWRTIRTRVQDYLDADDCDEPGLSWDGGVLKLVLCEGDVSEWVVLGSVDIH